MKDCVTEHINGFEHFEPHVAGLDDYDLGVKYFDNIAPPPLGSSTEPALFVCISVFQISSERDIGTIYYCRYRSFLQDGLPRNGTGSSSNDRARTLSSVLQRLPMDVALLAKDRLTSSEAAPISV
jgi:hypothetical protein